MEFLRGLRRRRKKNLGKVENGEHEKGSKKGGGRRRERGEIGREFKKMWVQEGGKGTKETRMLEKYVQNVGDEAKGKDTSSASTHFLLTA